MRRILASRCSTASPKSHPGPSPGSRRVLRSMRQGLADRGLDDSRAACLRASPTLGRRGNFFWGVLGGLPQFGEGFVSPGAERDAGMAHVAWRSAFMTLLTGLCYMPALRWAAKLREVQPARWAGRLSTVRGIARQAHGVDERHEIPPPGLLTGQYRRRPASRSSLPAPVDGRHRLADRRQRTAGARPKPVRFVI